MVYCVTQDIFYIPLHFQLLQLIGLTKRSLIKIKLNCLINTVCLQVRSITMIVKHGKYTLKVSTEK